MIYKSDFYGKRGELSKWLDEFTQYWNEAEKRIINKEGYVSDVQRIIQNKSTVEDVVKDLRTRVGLDKIEQMLKESGDSNSSDKKAASIPGPLLKNKELYDSVIERVTARPFSSYESLCSDLKYPNELDDNDVRQFVKDMIEAERRNFGIRQKTPRKYHVDYVDARDNKVIFDVEDRINKI